MPEAETSIYPNEFIEKCRKEVRAVFFARSGTDRALQEIPEETAEEGEPAESS